MQTLIFKTVESILGGRGISFKEAQRLYTDTKISLADLLWSANKVREKFKKNRIDLCSIVNAKSGNCPEDCRFCAQSARSRARIERYPLIDVSDILEAAKGARKNKATCFGIVTSGKKIGSGEEIAAICKAVTNIKKNIPSLKCSASLGTIDRQFMVELKKSGLERFHHNLETSENYFSKVCTTHAYKDRMRTIEEAKGVGLKICSGGIFGLGESRADRLKLAFTLRALEVESVPLNFLHPIKGTALENSAPMPPSEILRTIAMFRLILPKKDIKVCGGRAVNLRGLQPLIFFAGASGMMIGNYLTQPGQDPAEDLRMIKDLGLKVKC